MGILDPSPIPASEFLQLEEGLGLFSLLLGLLMFGWEAIVGPSKGMLDRKGRPDGLRRLVSL